MQFYQNDSIAHAKSIDTTVKQDTIQLLNDLKNNAPTLKFKDVLKRLFYKAEYRMTSNTPEIQNNQNLAFGEGKIIRHIKITTLDPFGYSDRDSTIHPTNSFEKWGNKLHLKTKNFTIKSFLLFKSGQTFDSLKIKESERLLRTQKYIRRVFITPIPTSSPDSVDVLVRELDTWTIYPTGGVSTLSLRARLTERNFLGLGHEIVGQYYNEYKQKYTGWYFNYVINNIQRTFINANVQYHQDVYANYIKKISFERPFYTPYAKWGGGITILQNSRRDSLPSINKIYSYEPIKYNLFDYWAGYSIPLFTSYKNKPLVTNLRISGRYIHSNYTKYPTEAYDPDHFYSDKISYLGSIGISTIDYIQDHYIFNNGIIEDVQVGREFSITSGVQRKYQINIPYFGTKFSLGNYTKYGYFAGNIEWGSNINHGKLEQTALKVSGSYFTKLFLVKDWKFRHFLNPELIFGTHRMDHMGDELKMDNAISGLKAQKVTGTHRLALSYRWQSYSPYRWKGFRFDPFFSYEGAVIGNSIKAMFNSRMYSRFSLGLVTNNDYLVFSRVSFSLVYYPLMPDLVNGGYFSTNTIDYNIELPRFNHDKPQTVSYY